MKKMIKAAAAVLLTAFVLSFAACSYEAGYSNEMPSAQNHPNAWNEAESESPSVEEPSLSGIDVPSVPSQDDDNNNNNNEEDFSSFVGVPVPLSEFGGRDAFLMMAMMAGMQAGTDYTISGDYITFTASGIEKMKAMESMFGDDDNHNDDDDDDFNF